MKMLIGGSMTGLSSDPELLRPEVTGGLFHCRICSGWTSLHCGRFHLRPAQRVDCRDDIGKRPGSGKIRFSDPGPIVGASSRTDHRRTRSASSWYRRRPSPLQDEPLYISLVAAAAEPRDRQAPAWPGQLIEARASSAHPAESSPPRRMVPVTHTLPELGKRPTSARWSPRIRTVKI